MEINLSNLRIKLVTAFIVLTAVPLIGFGSIVYVKGVGMVREKTIAHLSSVLAKDAQMISSFIAERIADLTLLAKTSLAEDGSSAGSVVSRWHLMRKEYGVYADVLGVDRNGRTIFAVGGPPRIGTKDIADQAWFQAGLRGEVFVGDVVTADTPGISFILVSVPIQGRKGTIRGVLVARVDLNVLDAALSGTRIGKTGEIYLVNKAGYFLTTTRIGGSKRGERIKVAGPGSYFGEIGSNEYIDYRGQRVLRVYEGLPGLEWILIAEQDSAEAFNRIHSLQRSVAAIVLVLMAVTSITGYIISSRITRLLGTSYREKQELELQIVQKDKLASLGLLTAGIAHEINTPLANALLYTQMAKEDAESGGPPARDVLDSIEEEIKRCGGIVRNLLDFSRQSQVGSTTTDVNEVLSKLLAIAGKVCAEKGITVKKFLEENIPPVKGSASVLHQVFMNLVANAVEAMEDGGSLEVSTRYTPVLQKVRIEIGDTGPGIPQECVNNVFDPFFTTKKSGEGTGLGLAISYGMVRKLGGNIRVASTCSQSGDIRGPSGTTFAIDLPVDPDNGSHGDS